MNTRVLRAGADRFRTETRIILGDPNRILLDFQLLFVAIYVTTCLLASPDADSGQFLTSPSTLAMTFMMLVLAQGGTFSVAQSVISARESGTLLRLRLLPGGLAAYVVEKCLHVLCMSLVSLTALLVTAFTLGGLTPHTSFASWLTALGFLTLGLLFFVTLGLVLGAALPDGGDLLGYASLGVYAIAAAAGTGAIAYLPGPLQYALRFLPFEWIVNGIDAGLTAGVPLGFVNGGHWSPLLALLLTGVWTASALAVAVPLLRRMTRRASGSDLARRQENAQNRTFG
ncbi:ABC transporter permease [Nocardiopsis valliformis]|uniref:ABC transporter permease n=1 Tax=Nocardiopsis valliformis TaxID=239974 RepID=UPI00034CAE31|nr:ABC transporter permease [Nocardiopsis valliformis]